MYCLNSFTRYKYAYSAQDGSKGGKSTAWHRAAQVRELDVSTHAQK